jgi:hypothetical protein
VAAVDAVRDDGELVAGDRPRDADGVDVLDRTKRLAHVVAAKPAVLGAGPKEGVLRAVPEQAGDDIGVAENGAMRNARRLEIPDLRHRIHHSGADGDVCALHRARRAPLEARDRGGRIDGVDGARGLVEVPDAQREIATARGDDVAIERVPLERQTRSAVRRDRSLSRGGATNVPHLHSTIVKRSRKVIRIKWTELNIAHSVGARVKDNHLRRRVANIPIAHSAILRTT